MDFYPTLKALWRQRHAAWFKDNYEHAVNRMTLEPNDGGGYIFGPTCQDSTDSERTIVDVDGSELTAGEARARAFELLVLADAADLNVLADASAPEQTS